MVDLAERELEDHGPPPVRLLPTWDAILLTHCRSAVVIEEEDRPRIFTTRLPQSMSAFTVDGTAAGTWREVEGRDRVRRMAADRRHHRAPHSGWRPSD